MEIVKARMARAADKLNVTPILVGTIAPYLIETCLTCLIVTRHAFHVSQTAYTLTFIDIVLFCIMIANWLSYPPTLYLHCK